MTSSLIIFSKTKWWILFLLAITLLACGLNDLPLIGSSPLPTPTFAVVEFRTPTPTSISSPTSTPRPSATPTTMPAETATSPPTQTPTRRQRLHQDHHQRRPPSLPLSHQPTHLRLTRLPPLPLTLPCVMCGCAPTRKIAGTAPWGSASVAVTTAFTCTWPTPRKIYWMAF